MKNLTITIKFELLQPNELLNKVSENLFKRFFVCLMELYVLIRAGIRRNKIISSAIGLLVIFFVVSGNHFNRQYWIWLLLIIFLAFKWDGKLFGWAAGGSLLISTLLFMAKKVEIANIFAAYAFYFLVASVVSLSIEFLRTENKGAKGEESETVSQAKSIENLLGSLRGNKSLLIYGWKKTLTSLLVFYRLKIHNNNKSYIWISIIIIVLYSVLFGFGNRLPRGSLFQPLKQIESGQSIDSDGDGLSNEQELIFGTHYLSADTDGDGLSDYEEVKIYNTDAFNQDSDGDGFLDNQEIKNGYDPLGFGKIKKINE